MACQSVYVSAWCDSIDGSCACTVMVLVQHRHHLIHEMPRTAEDLFDQRRTALALNAQLPAQLSRRQTVYVAFAREPLTCVGTLELKFSVEISQHLGKHSIEMIGLHALRQRRVRWKLLLLPLGCVRRFARPRWRRRRSQARRWRGEAGATC